MKSLLRCSILTAMLAVMAAAGLSSLAAQQTGRVSGTVTDATKEVLPGAAISLQPGNRSTTTDAQGNFQILGLPPNAYTLTVSYVGFQAASLSVQVAAGGSVTVQPILQLSSSSQQIVVTAPRPYGEAEAINTQRTADNIIDVLPEEVITSLPNANVADAVGRMPGVTLERDEGEGKYLQIRGTEPRLSNTTVDGVELEAPESGIRQVKLDVIPADLVGSVQLNKTLQPDQSGDAIGGSVNLVTKTAGNQPTLTLYANGGLTPIDNTRYSGEAGGTAGRRWGASQDWGAILSGSFDANGRGIDDVEPVPDAGATVATPLMDNADFRQYLYHRTRGGVGGSLDHAYGAGSTIYIHGLFADFVDGGFRTIYNLNTSGSGPAASSEQRIGNYLVSSLMLGGMQQLPDSHLQLDWQVAGARSRMLYPQFDNTGSFAYVGPASQCSFDSAATTNPYLPQFAPVCFTEAYNPANFSLVNEKLGGYGQSAKLDWSGRLDLTRFGTWQGNPNTLKLGASYDHRHEFDDSWNVQYNVNVNPNTGNPYSIPESLFLSGSYYNSAYYNSNYTAGRFISYDAIHNYVAANAAQFSLVSTQGADPEDYGLNESIPSVYAMDTYDVGRFRLTGGVRVEHTDLNTLSPDANGALTVPGVYAYNDLLPDAAVQFRLDPESDLRLAFGRGLSRPIPSDLTAAVALDLGVNPHTASLGNPGLKPEHGSDLDLLYERFLNPLGTVRAGFFYKYLTNPIVSLQTEPSTGPYAGYRVTQPANAGSAYIDGVEFEYDQQFTYLPGLWRGFGLMANYSYATSQARNVAPGVRTDSPALLRQAPNTWNFSPTYDRGWFSGRLGLAYNGANIYQYNYADGDTGGVTGPSGDVYEYTHFQVDAQLSAVLSHAWTVTFSGLNLNNAVFGFYQGSPQFMIQREYYHPTYSVGLRWTIGGE